MYLLYEDIDLRGVVPPVSLRYSRLIPYMILGCKSDNVFVVNTK